MAFALSLSHLVDTPRLYGWNWDVQVGQNGLPDLSDPIVSGLAEGESVVVSGQFLIDSEANLRSILARLASEAPESGQ